MLAEQWLSKGFRTNVCMLIFRGTRNWQDMPMVIQDFGKSESESDMLGSIAQMHVLYQDEGAGVVLIDFSWSHLTESKFCCQFASIDYFAGA